ncbi:MAG TPA: amino acid adenylation domain-containing protein [Streptosporangiaceae bacterium]|nr:amino acid adenylation domain-containing protein [Streptosporangiaceae bacterium]
MSHAGVCDLAISDSEPLIHRAVARQAQLRPDATALIERRRPVSYRTLDRAASRYASELSALGIGVGDVVPMLLPRSARLAALQLAVLKCGAAYAGLDRRWPAERIAAILGQISPAVVITDSPLGEYPSYQPPAADLEAVAAACEEQFHPPELGGAAPATVFFTSGTTGMPKGVVSPHQAVTRLFRPGGLDGFGPGHATPQVAPLPWDMYAFELWGQLTSGGTTVLVEDDHFLPGALRELVRDCGVDTLWITTSLFNLFVDEDADCFKGLGQVLTGGEKLSPAHVRAFLRCHPDIPLRNGYGPAESCMLTTTRLLTLADCDVAGGIPVGTALAGTTVLVLDADDQPCPAGEPGEVCIAGKGLATGYLASPELTAEKFPTIDYGGVPLRIYRTGDVGAFDSAGVLHFRGRRDRQVKISGHRVEMTEIEATARGLAGVRDCVALPLTAPDGQVVRLALFYLASTAPDGTAPDGTPPERDANTDPLAVSDQLVRLLPAYAVPAIVRWLDRFPVTPNGKLDRAELARIARTSRRRSAR